MSFDISLSGINASSDELNVIGNNIANSETTGFKTSTVAFSDVYATGSLNLNPSQSGEGVSVAGVDQQFTQGNITQTGNNLDMAISGQGFFTVQDPSGYYYTRNGTFSVNNLGQVVNSTNQQLQVYPPLATGGFNTGALTSLTLSSSESAPSPTANVGLNLNLPANAVPPIDTPFSPTDANSYTQTTSTTVYDSLGNPHTATFYYIATGTPNQWNMAMTIDGNAVTPSPADPNNPYNEQPLDFSTAGAITTPANGKFVQPAYTPVNSTGQPSASPLTLTVNMTGTTQFGTAFGVNAISQDGYSTGALTTISTSADGVVSANYTNGRSVPLGQLALANFANPQGLAPVGNSNWAQTAASGAAVKGTAGSANLGTVQAGALESSNVDVTAELVNMISTQRAFQANAQMITTQSQITQTIIQAAG